MRGMQTGFGTVQNNLAMIASPNFAAPIHRYHCAAQAFNAGIAFSFEQWVAGFQWLILPPWSSRIAIEAWD